jgi:hypothetical protein
MKGALLTSWKLTSDFGLENAFRNRSTFTKVSRLALAEELTAVCGPNSYAVVE